jgi:hypothetical protein
VKDHVDGGDIAFPERSDAATDAVYVVDAAKVDVGVSVAVRAAAS